MKRTVHTPNGLELEAEIIRSGNGRDLCILQDRLILVDSLGHILYQVDLLDLFSKSFEGLYNDGRTDTPSDYNSAEEYSKEG